jgi:alanine racemase
MVRLGTDFLGVDSFIEAKTLRESGVTAPILILGYTMPEVYDQVINLNISITVSSFDILENIKKLTKDNTKKLKIHLKVDTGMHRQGFLPEEYGKMMDVIQSMTNVELEGLYSHFAASKNPAFPKDTFDQIEKFEKAVEIVEKAGFKPIKHLAATSGAILFPDSHFDMVRIGIGIMGLWPSAQAKACAEDKITLKSALSWQTIVTEIKELPKGEKISYDLTETLRRDTKMAILPIGYWHGFRRSLSSVADVLIRGQRAKVLGRVTMGMTMIDVTDIADIQIGDIVTLIGKSGSDCISAEEMANLTETSNYEIVTQLNPLIRRVYQDE